MKLMGVYRSKKELGRIFGLSRPTIIKYINRAWDKEEME